MKIIEIKDIEACLDGTFIKEVLYDIPASKDYIHYLGSLGKLNYYPTFARPFYKLIVQNNFELKGVEGNTTSRIILYPPNIEESFDYFKTLVTKY